VNPVPEINGDDRLVLAGIGRALVNGVADVHAVVQELVKEALVDRRPAPGGIIPLRWAT
jgi:hypothetical protein